MSELIQNLVFKNSGLPLLGSFLDMASMRHKMIAGNMANVSTPKYKSQDIDFHGELKRLVNEDNHIRGKTTHPAHIPIGQSRDKGPNIIVNQSKNSNGINNVDIDKEVGNMAQNQIYYSIGARLLASKFEGLRGAIKSE